MQWEQEWKNAREQGAKGENLKGAVSKDPPKQNLNNGHTKLKKKNKLGPLYSITLNPALSIAVKKIVGKGIVFQHSKLVEYLVAGTW